MVSLIVEYHHYKIFTFYSPSLISNTWGHLYIYKQPSCHYFFLEMRMMMMMMMILIMMISGVPGEEDQRSRQRTAVCHEGPEEGHPER